MNLPYTYSLLVAANEQRHGFIKLVGMHADQEVRQMAEAGLVDATFNDGEIGSFTSINRVLEAGQMFLRTFHDGMLPVESSDAERTACHMAMLDQIAARLN